MEKTKKTLSPVDLVQNMEENIAHNVKLLVSLSGLNQTEFANLFDSKNKSVSNWINSINVPPLSKVFLMCDYFNINIDVFLRYKLKTEKIITVDDEVDIAA